jgi:hypothetical protein
MWWRASTTMRLVHTPEPDTIAPLPVRRQQRAKGLDTLAGGTPVRMYRQECFNTIFMDYWETCFYSSPIISSQYN